MTVWFVPGDCPRCGHSKVVAGPPDAPSPVPCGMCNYPPEGDPQSQPGELSHSHSDVSQEAK